MTLPSRSELVDSLERCNDIASWVNEILAQRFPSPEADLMVLEQYITQTLTALDIAREDTSSELERTIDDVSRTIPRLVYDLQFMKDGAITLHGSLSEVLDRLNGAVPLYTTNILERLQYLDKVKSRMEATRDVLREAESWSSLEIEITTLLAEHNYAKAAERLSEASRSMVVFQNTTEYEARQTLMVNLQNQLEASLSSALVSAISAQDTPACKQYFIIFSQIERETEFRNYYNAARRSSLVATWLNAHLTDCDARSPSLATEEAPSQPFVDFLKKFYGNFYSVLEIERVSMSAIFPDPIPTLSAFISSTLSSLQPSFSQRLASFITRRAGAVLNDLIALLQATEDFSVKVHQLVGYIHSGTFADDSSKAPERPSIKHHLRRRSTRMSISWSAGLTSSLGKNDQDISEVFEWEQDLFSPFVELQIDYGALERRYLDHQLRAISHGKEDSRADRARLLKERAMDVFRLAGDSLSRQLAFTHGYGTVGLVQALDTFLQTFIEGWMVEVHSQAKPPLLVAQTQARKDDFSDMDYSEQDWSEFQRLLHLLSSALAAYERLGIFETKLRQNIADVAAFIRSSQSDPDKRTPKGELYLLRQSPLNSADLQELLDNIEASAEPGHQHPTSLSRPSAAHASSPLLTGARNAIFQFVGSCQRALQDIILSPLRNHLSLYSQSSAWVAPGNPKAKHVVTANDLQVPMFSLSPTDVIQRVAEGLLNLPRLFEVYAEDDALAFSLHTLPYTDLNGLSLPGAEQASLGRVKSLDVDAVSTTWLSSLGHSLLAHLTTTVLPQIATLTPAGAAQLASDLEYLSNIMQTLHGGLNELDRWKAYFELDNAEGKQRLLEEPDNEILHVVGRLRNWV